MNEAENDILNEYQEKIGSLPFMAAAGQWNKLIELATEALNGDRGPVTEEDFIESYNGSITV